MAASTKDAESGPDAVALPATPGEIPRGLTDNRKQAAGRAPSGAWAFLAPDQEPDNDPPGLPLVLVMLDVPQPFDECGTSAGGKPPKLHRDTPYDARWTADNAIQWGPDVKVVYAGGPKAINAALATEWVQWWEQTHNLTVSTAGWCVYRYFDPEKLSEVVPVWTVMELPALTSTGKRVRVRAVTAPSVWRMSSETTIDRRSRALVPMNLTIGAEAEAGPQGFAARWRAYRRRRKG